MKIIFPRIESKEKIFFFAYGIYLFFTILNTSFYAVYFMNYLKYIWLFCILLLLFQEAFINHRLGRNALSGMLILGAMSFFIFITASNIQIIAMLVFIYAGRNISFTKIARFTVWVSSVIVMFVVFSAYLGIIQNYVSYTDARVRRYMGFRYTLYAPTYAFNISALVFYIHRQDIKWKHIIVVFLLNTWFYIETVSRLSYALVVLLLLFAVIMKKWSVILYRKSFVWVGPLFSFLICCFTSIILTIIFNGSVEWMKKLNTILGYRLSLGRNSLFQYGITWLGRDINWTGYGLSVYGERSMGTYTYVDCLYIQMLQRYGIVFTILYLGLHTLTLFQCYKNRNYYFMIILTFLAVHSMVDDLTLYLHFNTFWFVIGIVLFSSHRLVDEEIDVGV